MFVPGRNTVLGVAYSPDGDAVATGSLDRTCKVEGVACTFLAHSIFVISLFAGAFERSFNPNVFIEGPGLIEGELRVAWLPEASTVRARWRV